MEDRKSAVLAQIGLERMVEAHTAGRDVIVAVDGVVIFRLPAWWVTDDPPDSFAGTRLRSGGRRRSWDWSSGQGARREWRLPF